MKIPLDKAQVGQLLEESFAEYGESAPGELGEQYFRQAAGLLGQAFDIVIATENEKNEDKR